MGRKATEPSQESRVSEVPEASVQALIDFKSDNDDGKSNSSSNSNRGNEQQPNQIPLQQSKPLRPGQLVSFSAFSVLLYLNDDFEGGETTFFRHDPVIRVSRRGLAPHPDDVDKLEKQ